MIEYKGYIGSFAFDSEIDSFHSMFKFFLLDICRQL